MLKRVFPQNMKSYSCTAYVLFFQILALAIFYLTAVLTGSLTHLYMDFVIRDTFLQTQNSFTTEAKVSKIKENQVSSQKITMSLCVQEKKGRYLIQSYEKSPYTNRKFEKPKDNTNMPPKTSITQRLRTDL